MSPGTAVRTALVTGGAGFLGRHVVACLLDAGWDAVRVLDREPEARDGPPDPRVSHVTGDVGDAATVARAATGATAVIHAAFAPPGQPPHEIERVNRAGTAAVLEAARANGAGVVVVSSTIVERRLRPHPLLAGAPISRLHRYQTSRIDAEAQAADAARAGQAVAVVRPATFVGPGRLGGFALVFDSIRRGAPVTVLGRGENRYHLLDVRDLARGLEALAAAGAQGRWWFGSAEVGTVNHDLTALIDHAGTGSPLRHVPGVIARPGLRSMEWCGLAPLADWHQRSARGVDLVLDTSRARDELGWSATGTNVDALVAAYDWFVGASMTGAPATTHPVPRWHRLMHRLSAPARSGRDAPDPVQERAHPPQ